MLARKQIFAEALLKHVSLAGHIRRVLDGRPGHRAPATRFLRELEDHLSEEEAERVLDTVINWGRHAEIFAYDLDTESQPRKFLMIGQRLERFPNRSLSSFVAPAFARL